MTLFNGLTPDETEKICSCAGARTREFAKGQTIIAEGEDALKLGVISDGKAQLSKTNIIIKKGDYIGLLAAASKTRSPVTVRAVERLTALFLPFDKMLCPCQKLCPCHLTVIANITAELSENALSLQERMDCLLKPTVREKLAAYLTRESRGSAEAFSITLNRRELANYLNVERSALSRELSRMKKEGVIDYHMNMFKIFGNISQ